MPHDPARPCRPEGGFGLVMIMITFYIVPFGGNSVDYSTRVLVNYDDDQKPPLNLIKETIGLRFTLWTELAEAMNVNSAERFQSHYKSAEYVCWQN